MSRKLNVLIAASSECRKSARRALEAVKDVSGFKSVELTGVPCEVVKLTESAMGVLNGVPEAMSAACEIVILIGVHLVPVDLGKARDIAACGKTVAIYSRDEANRWTIHRITKDEKQTQTLTLNARDIQKSHFAKIIKLHIESLRAPEAAGAAPDGAAGTDLCEGEDQEHRVGAAPRGAHRVGVDGIGGMKFVPARLIGGCASPEEVCRRLGISTDLLGAQNLAKAGNTLVMGIVDEDGQHVALTVARDRYTEAWHVVMDAAAGSVQAALKALVDTPTELSPYEKWTILAYPAVLVDAVKSRPQPSLPL